MLENKECYNYNNIIIMQQENIKVVNVGQSANQIIRMKSSKEHQRVGYNDLVQMKRLY